MLLHPSRFTITSEYIPEAVTYFNNIVSAGSSISETNADAVNALFVGLKALASPIGGVSVWDALKEFYILRASDTRAGAYVPVKGGPLVSNGYVDGDYSRTNGLISDGTSKWLVAARDSNDDPVDNQCVWVNITAGGLSTTGRFIGTVSLSAATEIIGGSSSGTTNPRFRSRSSTLNTLTAGPGTGLIGMSRHQSSDYVAHAFGTTATITQASTTPSGSSLIGIGATGSGSQKMAQTASEYGIGEAQDLAGLYTLLQTFGASLI